MRMSRKVVFRELYGFFREFFMVVKKVLRCVWKSGAAGVLSAVLPFQVFHERL